MSKTLDLNYSKMAEGIIGSAVKEHLRGEIKIHCKKVAKTKATAWLRKNRKSLEDSITKAVDKRLDDEKDALITKLVKQVKVSNSRSYRYY